LDEQQAVLWPRTPIETVFGLQSSMEAAVEPQGKLEDEIHSL
jgi:hypothetical protein